MKYAINFDKTVYSRSVEQKMSRIANPFTRDTGAAEFKMVRSGASDQDLRSLF